MSYKLIVIFANTCALCSITMDKNEYYFTENEKAINEFFNFNIFLLKFSQNNHV